MKLLSLIFSLRVVVLGGLIFPLLSFRTSSHESTDLQCIEISKPPYLLMALHEGPPTGSCPCDWDRIGNLNDEDFFLFLDDFFQDDGDFDLDGDTDLNDYYGFVDCFSYPATHGC